MVTPAKTLANTFPFKASLTPCFSRIVFAMYGLHARSTISACWIAERFPWSPDMMVISCEAGKESRSEGMEESRPTVAMYRVGRSVGWSARRVNMPERMAWPIVPHPGEGGLAL
jgi:hypothetical protein